MKKALLYVTFFLAFLVVSVQCAPGSGVKKYIVDKSSYSKVLSGGPLSAILQDVYRLGFIVKSNIHRYQVVRAFGPSEVITLRVSRKYFKQTLGFIGLSLFRRKSKQQEETTPLPPGSLFVGDLSYGHWARQSDGTKSWLFFGTYRHLREKFLWGSFKPNYAFYQSLRNHVESRNVQAFLGPQNEFGSEGSITRAVLPLHWYKNRNQKLSLDDYIKAVMAIPLLGKN